MLTAYSVKTSYQEYRTSGARSETTQGTLTETEIVQETDSDGNISYSTDAVLLFDISGKTYKEEVRIDGSHEDGDTHVVHYNPDDPDDHSIYSSSERKTQMIFGVIMCIVGAVAIAVLVWKLVTG